MSMNAGVAVLPGREQSCSQHAKVRAKVVDHPLVAWLLENGCIVGVASLRALLPRPDVRSAWLSFLRTFAGGLTIIEGCLLAQTVLVHRVYSHVPFFSELASRTSKMSWAAMLTDWSTCNLPVHLLGSSTVALAILTSRRKPKAGQAAGRPTRLASQGPMAFLFKLALARVVADVVFFAVHRVLHTKALYGRVHKRHHEHKAPALNTNFHFTAADLFIEGFVPLAAALASLKLLFRVSVAPLEEYLVMAYIQWYEIGSHSGKPVPTATYLPPLAPLYRLLFGDVDKRNIEFHHAHHALTHCNYGITQWIDRAVGTARFCATRASESPEPRQHIPQALPKDGSSS